MFKDFLGENNVNKKIFLIFIFAFLIRIIYSFFLVPQRFEILYPDSVSFNKLAVNLIAEKEFSLEKGKPLAQDPLYPAFLAGIYSIFGQSLDAVKFFQSLIGALTILFVYGIARKIFSNRVAILSTLISSVYPFFIYYTAAILRETLLVFLLVTSIFLLLSAKENKWLAFFSGISLALLTLIKSLNILLVLFVFCVFLFLEFKKSDFKFRNLYFLLLIFLSFSICYSPWLYRNYKVFNRFILSSGRGVNLYYPLIIPPEIAGTDAENEFYKNDPITHQTSKMSELEKDDFLYQKAIEIIKERPEYFIKKCLFRFLKLWRLYPYRGKTYAHSDILLIVVSLLSYGLLLPFAIYGAFLAFKEINKTFLLYLPIIVYSFVYSVFWAQIRYRLPLEPFVIIFASYSIVFLLAKYGFQRLG